MFKRADASQAETLPEDTKSGVEKNDQFIECSHCGALNLLREW